MCCSKPSDRSTKLRGGIRDESLALENPSHGMSVKDGLFVSVLLLNPAGM